MEIAIIGQSSSGKSTLFRIMTGVDSSSCFEASVRGIAKIPDNRFLKLVEIFKPKKATPAAIPFLDLKAPADEKGWAAVRQNISGANALIHVVGAFGETNFDKIISGYKKIEDDMIFSDLVAVENRLERVLKLSSAALKPDEKSHREILPKFKTQLESGRPLRDIEFSDSEISAVKGFAFLSLKPEIVVINAAEGSPDISEKFSAATGQQAIQIQCSVEQEIAELPPEDRREFLDSLGIETPAFEKIIAAAFSTLNSIYYFTVGEDEVRAWVIKKGSTAPEAAAAIHKDFQRGFIKAEVAAYGDFIACEGSLAQTKSKGRLRLEGKEYIVADGDIISFRFNV